MTISYTYTTPIVTGNLYNVAGLAPNGMGGSGSIAPMPGAGSYIGPATSVAINDPTAVVIDAAGNIFFSEVNQYNRVRKITPSGGLYSVSGSDMAWGGYYDYYSL